MQGTKLEAAVAHGDHGTLLKRANVAQSPFDQFLSEATHRDQGSDSTLEGDAFYGLYTSWCYLSHHAPEPRADLLAGDAGAHQSQAPVMKGPAATDYILISYRAVV